MKKRRKRKKNRIPLIYKAGFMMLGVSVIIWLGSSLFLRSYNINLSMELQETEQEIESMMLSNDALKVEIQALESRERITNIAEDAGLNTNANSIITVDE